MKFFLLTVCALSVLPVWAAETVRAVLFPFREAVIATQVDSRLMPYSFRIGQRFKKGDILVKLDDERLVFEHRRAEDVYNFSKASFENKQRLRERNFTSDYELKKAQFDKDMAFTALGESKLKLSYCQIKAPFDGRIVEIMTREFETVKSGQPLCRIIDDTSLLAVMHVPMYDKNLTASGNEVKVKLDSGKIVTGVIYEVFPQADHRSGTIRIRVRIDNSNGELTSGATGELYNGK